MGGVWPVTCQRPRSTLWRVRCRRAVARRGHPAPIVQYWHHASNVTRPTSKGRGRAKNSLSRVLGCRGCGKQQCPTHQQQCTLLVLETHSRPDTLSKSNGEVTVHVPPRWNEAEEYCACGESASKCGCGGGCGQTRHLNRLIVAPHLDWSDAAIRAAQDEFGKWSWSL
jgi:hypothetical protein